MIKNSKVKLYIKSVSTNQILVTFSKVVEGGATALLAINEDQVSSTANVLIVWCTESLEDGGYLSAQFDNGTRAIAISYGKNNGVIGCDTEEKNIKKIFFTFEKIASNQFYIKSDGKYLSVDVNGFIELSKNSYIWSL